MLTRDQILSADDLRYVEVKVPEWGGGTVRLQTMTARERRELQGKPLEEFVERIVILCAVDDKGNRLFEEKDLDAVSGKSALALKRLFDAAVELNGLGAESVDVIKGE